MTSGFLGVRALSFAWRFLAVASASLFAFLAYDSILHDGSASRIRYVVLATAVVVTATWVTWWRAVDARERLEREEADAARVTEAARTDDPFVSLSDEGA